MEIVGTIEDVRKSVSRARDAGNVIGLVPTMGGLHEGHLSLIDAAREACTYVVVSIFVNPTQFGPGEDLHRYPRTPQDDLDACRAHAVDLVFAPTVEVMYGPDCQTAVTVAELAGTLCGRGRPTHFAGVCTVVAKLFNIVGPCKAFFGQKDFQQAVIIGRMVADLDFPVEIVTCPIVRERDGLAASTRNRYLSPQDRSQAAALNAALRLAAEHIRRAHPPPAEVIAQIRKHLAEAAPGGRIEYVQIVDPLTLSDVETTKGAVLVALAVKFAGARLIDNILMDSGTAGP
jgi:pantoate--beta-alanine ligase